MIKEVDVDGDGRIDFYGKKLKINFNILLTYYECIILMYYLYNRVCECFG